jgi:hypothetical protein
MPFLDADAIDYGRNGYQDVGEALDDIIENRTWDGEVDYFTDLPSAIANDGKTYYVKKYTLLSPIRLTGLYYSTGGAWKRRSDKVTYTLINFTGTNKLVKTADTKGQIIETPIEIDANDDLDLKDNNILNVGSIQFDITQVAPTPAEGKLVWSDTEGTLNLGMKGGDVNQQIGLELFLRAKAIGSAISNGDVVYVSGASGNNPEMSLAKADLLSTSECTIAVATEDILENALGYYTTFGKVREIDTSSFPAGSIVYLSDSVAGALTLTPPSAPSNVIKVGIILNQNVDEGIINVCIEFFPIFLDRDATKEPTGFTDPEDVIITGDGTARTVTITGTVNAYYKGVYNTTIVSGWESPAHNNDTNSYYLIYDGTAIQWVTPANFKYYYLQIAFTFYANGTNERVYSRECHGIMPWQSHAHFHEVSGTIRQSGGDLADYVLLSTTATDRRPSVSATSIVDEDLKTINSLLASDSNYTQHWIAGAGADSNFSTTPVDIVPLLTNQPYWNEFTGGAWQQTLMSNNYFMSIWVIAIPVASDNESQAYRYIFIQGQSQSLTISPQRELIFSGLNLGDLVEYAPEFTPFKQIIIKYTAGNWRFEEVIDLTGSLNAQITIPSGNFLTIVSTDTTLTGAGTAGDPLGIALNNANTWTEKQIFGNIGIDGNTITSENVNGHIILDPNGTGTIKNQSTFINNYLPADLTYPTLAQYNLAHNDVYLMFDAYHDGSNPRSSSVQANFQFAKGSASFVLQYDTGVSAGGIISWSTGMIMGTDGSIKFPDVYADSVATSPKILSIQSDGQLGESTTATPTFGSITMTNTINEFSIDGTLAGDSDSAVPTEKAVKTYVDGSVGGFLKADGSVPLTANWDAGSYKIIAQQLESDVATGTAPLIIASTTKVSNLNADKVDGYDFNQSLQTTDSPSFGGLSVSGSSPRSATFESTNDKIEINIKRGSTSRDAILRYFTTTSEKWRVGMTDDTTDDFQIISLTSSNVAFKAKDDGSVLITPASGKNITLDGTITIDGGVISDIDEIGIGVASPETSLHIKIADSGASLISNSYLWIENTADAFIQLNGGSNQAVGLRFGDSADADAGFIAYTTNSDIMEFGVNAGVRVKINGSGEVFMPDVYGDTVSSPRTMYIKSDGQLGGISSLKILKENIDYNFSTDWFYNLKPAEFNYKNSDEKWWALIADDCETTKKELCTFEGEELTGLEYAKLHGMYIKCIQEQKTLIDDLITRVEELER